MNWIFRTAIEANNSDSPSWSRGRSFSSLGDITAELIFKHAQFFRERATWLKAPKSEYGLWRTIDHGQ